MAYIESHQSLRNHKKLLRAASVWGMRRAEAIGYLHLLWWWAVDNIGPDGDLGDISDGELAMGADWPGDAELFAEGLRQAGFLDQTDGGRFLHDWMDYAGKYQARRAADRERARETYAARSSPAARDSRKSLARDSEETRSSNKKTEKTEKTDTSGHGDAADAATAGGEAVSPEQPPDTSAEQSVLDAWNEAWSPVPWPQKKRMTDKRRSHIHARLENFTVEELAQAAFNLRQSPHHTGQNDRAWVADPEFLYREDGQVEKWLHPAEPASVPNGRTKLTPQQESIANLPLLGRSVIDLEVPP